MNKIFFILMIVVIIILAVFAPREIEEKQLGYPRLAAVIHPCVDDSSIVENLARYDLIVMHRQHTTNEGRCNHSQIEYLRELNPNIIILVHVPQSYIVYPINGLPNENDINYPLLSKLTFFGEQEELQVLTDINGDVIVTDRPTWKEATTDITSYCPSNEFGDWNEQITTFTSDELLSSGLWDGIFWDSLYDSISWYNKWIDYPIDLDHDGLPDDPSWQNAQWKAGVEDFYVKAREKMGNDTIMIGNGRNYHYEYGNGMMIELFYNKPWIDQLEYTLDWEKNGMEPNYNFIVAQFNPNSGYRYRRFVFGTTLLTDSYYEMANNAYSEMWWLDEFAVDLKTGEAVLPTKENNYKGLHYLGMSLGNATEVDGVWRREFDNGIVLVNPTNSIKHVPLNGTYNKIKGTQDSVNNGLHVAGSHTMMMQDAIVLLK